MSEVPLHIDGKCIASDDVLFANMRHACSLGLPAVGGPVAMVGSGPSVAGQLGALRQMQEQGVPIVAIKDAHDWLIERHLIPDYAFALDPQEHRWNCFKHKHPKIHYYIASQCHASMFEHLHGHRVTLMHLYIKHGQTEPEGLLIGGGTTSGLRAISLFYTLGYRKFHLFGFDSCLSGNALRVDGSGVKPEHKTFAVTLGDGVEYVTSPSMALQASHFQEIYKMMPDAKFVGHGEGLIPAIIKKRAQQAEELTAIMNTTPPAYNGRVSFIHKMNMDSASYRYRAFIPSRELGLEMNDLEASTLVFSKIEPQELMEMGRAKARGQRVIVDFCDDHFEWMHYAEALRLADAVTCPTEVMRERIAGLGREATVIPDPWELPLCSPHFIRRDVSYLDAVVNSASQMEDLLRHRQKPRLLWFGHHVNRFSLQRIMPEIEGYPLRVVSNFGGAIPWKREEMPEHFAWADIVLLPRTEIYKSANRAVEAIRQGCFVVAESHPAWNDIPGIWIGNIKDGIEWAQRNPNECNRRITLSQSHVTAKYDPKTLASAWKSVTQSPTTLEPGTVSGPDGLVSTWVTVQT